MVRINLKLTTAIYCGNCYKHAMSKHLVFNFFVYFDHGYTCTVVMVHYHTPVSQLASELGDTLVLELSYIVP